MIWYTSLLQDMIWYGTPVYHMRWDEMTRYTSLSCDMIWYETAVYDIIWYDRTTPVYHRMFDDMMWWASCFLAGPTVEVKQEKPLLCMYCTWKNLNGPTVSVTWIKSKKLIFLFRVVPAVRCSFNCRRSLVLDPKSLLLPLHLAWNVVQLRHIGLNVTCVSLTCEQH